MYYKLFYFSAATLTSCSSLHLLLGACLSLLFMGNYQASDLEKKRNVQNSCLFRN